MASVTQRRAARLGAPRPVIRSAMVRRDARLSAQRRAMVLLGGSVLGASILGTIIGHVLSASAPI